MLTVAGHGVIRGVLSLPRVGAWHADLEVDASADVAGAVTLSAGDGALTLKGTVSAGSTHEGINRLRIVAGADGLRTRAKPQHFVRPTVAIVAGHLLRGAREAGLSPNVAQAVSGKALPAWTVIGNATGEQLSALCARAAPAGDAWAWRILPDGTLWIGPETWPASALTDWRELEVSPRDRRLELGLDAPTLLPGTKLGDRLVDYVEHHVGPGDVRARVWWT